MMKIKFKETLPIELTKVLDVVIMHSRKLFAEKIS